MDTIFALLLATATAGGGFPVYGDAFAEMVNAQEPRLRITTRNTKGSAENVPLLEANQVDIALAAGEELSRTGGAAPLGRLVELRAGKARAAERGGLSPRARDPSRGERVRRTPRAGTRDNHGEHACRSTATRAPSSGRRALPSRS